MAEAYKGGDLTAVQVKLTQHLVQTMARLKGVREKVGRACGPHTCACSCLGCPGQICCAFSTLVLCPGCCCQCCTWPLWLRQPLWTASQQLPAPFSAAIYVQPRLQLQAHDSSKSHQSSKSQVPLLLPLQDIDISVPYPQALGLADLREPLLAEWREALGTIMAGYYIDGRWKREGHRFCCSPEPSEWL